MARLAIQRDALNRPMSGQQDRAARSLIHPARLHPDEAVFHQIQPPDTIGFAQSVQLRQDRGRRQRFAIDRHRIAAGEIHTDHGRRIRCVFWPDGALIDRLIRFNRRVFQDFALGRRVQQVGIDRERRLAALVLRDGDLVLFGEFQQPRAAGQLPFAPRGDDFDVGLQRIIRQFESDLVVALAGRAVRHRVGADLFRDLDLPLCDQRARDGGAQQILALIQRVRAEHREHEILHERLTQIVDEDFLHPGHFGLLARRPQFLALAQVGGEGHDLASVGRLQPFQDHAGIQPARVGEHDFLYILDGHGG